jgi:hypothetical protein
MAARMERDGNLKQEQYQCGKNKVKSEYFGMENNINIFNRKINKYTNGN